MTKFVPKFFFPVWLTKKDEQFWASLKLSLTRLSTRGRGRRGRKKEQRDQEVESVQGGTVVQG